MLISFFHPHPHCPSIHFSLSLFCLLYPSLSLCQSVPESPALPYVTGAHIRENNLWLPWIRDAVEFPMIQVWYGNSLKYLDSGGLSDQCSPACCWQTHVSETSCQDDPWGWRRGEEKGQKKFVRIKNERAWKGRERKEKQRGCKGSPLFKCSILFFFHHIQHHNSPQSKPRSPRATSWHIG